ncbi:hypothetical protein F442_14710 [Phytophthora nicotianae P10297]|uniref:Uncharacterized protein n=1 Tax=Phytophthora nicotianae P10297 TaxID=1317064 RepID=W2YRA2_PHYNI|nr:hypothetical protein F442_14710 [Phytophthora nicotianae P10297]
MSATISIRRDSQQPAVGHFAVTVRDSNTDEEILAAISYRPDLQRRIGERYLSAVSQPTAAEPIATAPRTTITSLNNHGGHFDSFREIPQKVASHSYRVHPSSTPAIHHSSPPPRRKEEPISKLCLPPQVHRKHHALQIFKTLYQCFDDVRASSLKEPQPNEVTFSSRCRQNDSFQNHTIAQSTNGKRRYINTSPIPQPAATQALSAHVDGSIKRQLRPAVRTQVRQSTSTKGRKFKHRWQYIDPLPDKQPVRSLTSTRDGQPSSYLKATISTESVWPPPLSITSSKIIRQYLEEDLLRAEVATSRRLRTLGFRRVPIAKNTI